MQHDRDLPPQPEPQLDEESDEAKARREARGSTPNEPVERAVNPPPERR